MTCQVYMIFASDQNLGIGNKGKLPWRHNPHDMKWFKEQTKGQIVVMGRKTYESLPEQFRPLPDRTNVILTTNKDYKANALVFTSVEEILEHFKHEEFIFVIGGGEVYQLFAPYVNRVYQTSIPGKHACDVKMDLNCDDWDMIYHDSRLGDNQPYFQIFERLGRNDELEVELIKC